MNVPDTTPVRLLLISIGTEVGGKWEVERKRLSMEVSDYVFENVFESAQMEHGDIVVHELAATPESLELVLSNGMFRPVFVDLDWGEAWARAGLPKQRLVGEEALDAWGRVLEANPKKSRGKRGRGKAELDVKDRVLDVGIQAMSAGAGLDSAVGAIIESDCSWPSTWADRYTRSGANTCKMMLKRELKAAKQCEPTGLYQDPAKEGEKDGPEGG